ncbi:MAG: FecR domain-containing protein [Burkholderiaceae bacterium]|jgi:hypothetical protein|nr:FecR domain-containing protein [Burkholderiaceae bacterium]
MTVPSIGRTATFCLQTAPALGLALGLALGSAAVAAEPIGLIKVKTGDVQIERQGVRSAAAVGSPVDRSDRLITGRDGSVGVSFSDSSMLSAGPNSVLVLSEFNYDPTTRQGNFEVALRRGTLSAISGKLVAQTPGSMKVRTPSAVLAVRGTEFVVHVDAPAE